MTRYQIEFSGAGSLESKPSNVIAAFEIYLKSTLFVQDPYRAEIETKEEQILNLKLVNEALVAVGIRNLKATKVITT